jgi:hypothetical protein
VTAYCLPAALAASFRDSYEAQGFGLAKSVAISGKTLRRWQALPEFDRAYRNFGNAMFRQSLARLQQTSVAAVLRSILGDPNVPAVKARSAYYLLDQTREFMETDELEARIAELERVAESDESCLAPHSPEWLVFWDRQVYNYMTDRKHVPLTIDALRAVMRYSDNPASLVGRHSGPE